MTPPPLAEATADSLADLVYRPQVAAPGWAPSRRSVALGWSLCAYAGIALTLTLLFASKETPRSTPPRLTGTVLLVEAAEAVRAAPSSSPTPHASRPEAVTPVALPEPAPLPALATPATLPTPSQSLAAPSTTSSAEPRGQSGPVTSAPRFDAAYLNNPDPAYPAVSRRIGEEGRVILRVLVSSLGRAEQVEVRASSGSPRLDEAALAAVKRWRFEPARQGEAAIQAWVLVPISFHLDA